MDTATVGAPLARETARLEWSGPARVWFRFCFVYFLLYCFADQVITGVLIVPNVDVPNLDTVRPFRDLVFWLSAHLFQMKTPLVFQGSGSGDKHFDWVVVFCILVVSILGTLLWTAFDRKRGAYSTLQRWFLLFLRLCLGGQMIAYGLTKAVPLQMGFPHLARLVEQYGNFSPMGVLWSAVGASQPYEILAGCAELAGGLLLMFPRTVTLGALVCLADMMQVFVLNMTYDVPVKLLSFHLILIALLVLGPDLRRLWDFLVLNPATVPAKREPLFAGMRARRIAAGVVAFLWIWMLGNNAYGAWQGWHEYGPGAPKSPLYGIWNIQDYSLDGKPQPLLITDAEAWRGIVFEFPRRVLVELMDGSHGYGLELDPRAMTLTLTDPGDTNWQARFTYGRPEFDRLSLDGTIAGHKAVLHLRRVDEKKFLLESRGFHWVQDYSFNR
jgi:uncharacterized membrane protein YphA (DoxX/SURF4 family)